MPLPDSPVLLLFAGFLLTWGLSHLHRRRWRKMSLVTIIDGDTFYAVDLKGVRRKLRLRTVDCPEMDQRFGAEAKRYVQQLTRKKWVLVRMSGKDRYRRHLVDVKLEEGSLATLLVQEGLGYPMDGGVGLKLAAAGARLQGKGVHAWFGQPEPWKAKSRRGPSWLRSLKRRLKRWGHH